MKTFAKTTEETLVTFHIGRGGRYWNGGHKTYNGQDMTIDSYTDDLFTRYENQGDISHKIGDRENLRALFEKAVDNEDSKALERIEKLTGMTFGKQIHVDCNGVAVGLDVENDGTGCINIDNEYDTTAVCKLEDCHEDDLLIIYEQWNVYASSDVREFCRKVLLEKNMISEDEEVESNT